MGDSVGVGVRRRRRSGATTADQSCYPNVWDRPVYQPIGADVPPMNRTVPPDRSRCTTDEPGEPDWCTSERPVERRRFTTDVPTGYRSVFLTAERQETQVKQHRITHPEHSTNRYPDRHIL